MMKSVPRCTTLTPGEAVLLNNTAEKATRVTQLAHNHIYCTSWRPEDISKEPWINDKWQLHVFALGKLKTNFILKL